MLSHIVTDLHEHYVAEVLEPQIGSKNATKPSSSSSDSITKTEDDIMKQARQLVYDVRYRSRREDIPLEKAYTQHIGNSSASSKVKEIAKEKLFGKSGSSVAINPVKEDYVNEEKQETKFQVRVTDKSSGKTYVRMATRAKINQLRANPNIASVEMTKYGKPYEGEAKKGKLTAKVTSGKGIDHDGDGKIESSSKEHAGVVHNAIQRAKGGVPDGKDTRKKNKKVYGIKEQLSDWRSELIEINEIDNDSNKIKNEIKEKQVNNKITINPPLNLESFVKNLGGELINITEKDVSDYSTIDIFSELNDHEIFFLSDRFIDEIVEEVFYECIEEGYEINEIQETLIEAIDINADILNEAKDQNSNVKSDRLQRVKSGIKRVGKALARGVGYVAGAAVRGAKSAGKEFSSGYDRGKKGSTESKPKSTPSTSTSRKSKTSEPSLVSNIGTKLKKGLKKVVAKTARSVSRGARNVARSMENNKDSGTVESKKSKTVKTKKKKSNLDDLISSIRNESKVYEAIVDQPTPADDNVRDKQSNTVKKQQLSSMKMIQKKREQLEKQKLRLQQQDKLPIHNESSDFMEARRMDKEGVDRGDTRRAARAEKAKASLEAIKKGAERQAKYAKKYGTPATGETKEKRTHKRDFAGSRQAPKVKGARNYDAEERARVNAANRRTAKHGLTKKQRAMSDAIRAQGSLGT
jgi:hypothetical protein